MADQPRTRTRIQARGGALLALAVALGACGSGTAGAAPTNPAAPTATSVAATVTPRPPQKTAAATAAPVGEPLPDEMLGAWYMPAPGFWWFFRAGDPVCMSVVRT